MNSSAKDNLQAGILTVLTPNISRLIAPNPGPFTYTGTCTYIVGDDEVVVIDPGPDNDAHFQALSHTLKGKKLGHILVTHTHKDHSPLARRLSASTGAPIWGCSPHRAARPLFAGEANLLEGSSDTGHAPAHILLEGERIEGNGYSLGVVETPGHTSNHLAFSLEKTGALFCGDHVMGWSTTIVAPPDGDMADYMASLEKLRQREDALYYPGHGDVITQPNRLVRGILTHRRQRETSILARLQAGDRLISEIVPKIYEQLAPALHGAAALSVFAHLEDLVARGLVTSDGEPTLASIYRSL